MIASPSVIASSGEGGKIDQKIAGVEKFREKTPMAREMKVASYIDALQSGKYAEVGDEIQLPFDCQAAILEQIINEPEKIVAHQLTQTEVAALDYLGLLEPYLHRALNPRSPLTAPEKKALLKEAYPYTEYADWLKTMSPALQRTMVLNYLPSPIDQTIQLSSEHHRTITTYLQEHFDFDPASVPTHKDSQWIIAGSFVTSLCDPTKETTFNDIDLWVSGENVDALVAELIYLWTRNLARTQEAIFSYGNLTLQIPDLVTGLSVSVSINCCGLFTPEDLLRYFDLDPCKYIYTPEKVLTTIRAQEAILTRKVTLPGYYQPADLEHARLGEDAKQAEIQRVTEHNRKLDRSKHLPMELTILHLIPVPAEDSILSMRSYLQLGYHRIGMRMDKYQAKGFSFQHQPLEQELRSLLATYLPHGSWIADNYMQELETPCFFSGGPVTIQTGNNEITIVDSPAKVITFPICDEYSHREEDEATFGQLLETEVHERKITYGVNFSCRENDKIVLRVLPGPTRWPEPSRFSDDEWRKSLTPEEKADEQEKKIKHQLTEEYHVRRYSLDPRLSEEDRAEYHPLEEELFQLSNGCGKKLISPYNRLKDAQYGGPKNSSLRISQSVLHHQIRDPFTYRGFHGSRYPEHFVEELITRYPPKN